MVQVNVCPSANPEAGTSPDLCGTKPVNPNGSLQVQGLQFRPCGDASAQPLTGRVHRRFDFKTSRTAAAEQDLTDPHSVETLGSFSVVIPSFNLLWW